MIVKVAVPERTWDSIKRFVEKDQSPCVAFHHLSPIDSSQIDLASVVPSSHKPSSMQMNVSSSPKWSMTSFTVLSLVQSGSDPLSRNSGPCMWIRTEGPRLLLGCHLNRGWTPAHPQKTPFLNSGLACDSKAQQRQIPEVFGFPFLAADVGG